MPIVEKNGIDQYVKSVAEKIVIAAQTAPKGKGEDNRNREGRSGRR